MNTISGKVVVITGASSGLGEATARHLAAKGAKVVVAARRKARLDDLIREIVDAGGIGLALQADVTNRQDVEAIIAMAVRQFGKIDVLINNAGLMSIAPLNAVKVDEWERMIDINVKGVLYGIAATLQLFEKQQFGHYITISSIAGKKVFSPGGTVYSGTKFAVSAITEGLRHEVGGKIRTTIISPGLIDTELKMGSSHAESSKAVSELYQSQAISADAIARAIAYAIEQPLDVDVSEIVIRPTVQEF